MDTSTMTREQKEALLLGPPRFRVRFRMGRGQRLRSDETKHQKLPSLIPFLGGEMVVWSSQKDSTIWVHPKELIQDVVEEAQNYYGEWLLQKTYQVGDLGEVS